MSDVAVNAEVLGPFIQKNDKLLSANFQISGVKCGQCLRKIETRLQSLESVVNYHTSLDGHRIRLDVGHSDDFPIIMNQMASLGFPITPIKDDQSLPNEERLFKSRLKELAVAGVCSGNVMLFSTAIYLGADKHYKDFFLVLSIFLSLPVLLYSAAPILKGLWSGLSRRSFNLDVPIGLALVFGYIFSFVNYFTGSDEVYFDSLTMVVFLVLASRFILDRYLSSITQKSKGNIIPGVIQALVLDHNGLRKLISIHDVKKEHQVVVQRGDIIPVDGEIISSTAVVDNSILTGESEPVSLMTGDTVFAGCKNCLGEILIKPKRMGKDTRVGKLVESSTSIYRKAKYENLRLISLFTYAILITSFFVLLYFSYSGEVGTGFQRAFSMIIIACPCAVSFGFPLIRYSICRLALKYGILLRTPQSLSQLSKIRHVLFDKTGTLTSSIMRIRKESLDQFTKSDLFSLMALEAQIDHPISRGVLQHNPFTLLPDVKNFKYMAKLGIQGVVGGDLFELLSRSKINQDQDGSEDKKFIYVYKNSKLLGRIEMVPEVRASAENLFSFLEKKKINISILSGDTEKQVQKVWGLVPMAIRNDYLSEATPEDKLEFISKMNKETLMVGDGMNDILALRKATVGVAMPGAVEEDLKVSDIALLENDLGLIKEAFLLAQRMSFTEKMLFGFTFSYNFITVSLAISGHIQPVMAAILMPLSSFIVLNIVFWNLGRFVWK